MSHTSSSTNEKPLSIISNIFSNMQNDSRSIYDYCFNNINNYIINRRSFEPWFDIFEYFSFILSKKNDLDINDLLDNFKFNILTISITRNETKNDSFYKFRMSEIIKSFFYKLSELLSLNHFDYNNKQLLLNFLSAIQILLILYKYTTFFSSDELYYVDSYIKIIEFSLKKYSQKKDLKYKSIFSLIIYYLSLFNCDQIIKKKKIILKKEINENKNRINNNQIINYQRYYFIVNQSSFTIDKQEKIENENIKFDINDRNKTDMYSFLKSEQIIFELPNTNLLNLIDNFWQIKRNKIQNKVGRYFKQTNTYSLLNIGSNSLGIADTVSDFDLLLVPVDKFKKNLSLSEITQWLHPIIYENENNGNNKDNWKFYVSNGKIKLNDYEISIWRTRLLTCNNILMKIFTENSPITKLLIFYFPLFNLLGFYKRSHLCFLIISFLDVYYEIFNRNKRIFGNKRLPLFTDKEFVFLIDDIYYYDIYECIDDLKESDVPELIINFLQFFSNMVKFKIKENEENHFDYIPKEYFDQRFLFNLIEIFEIINQNIKNRKDNIINLIDSIKGKILYADDYNKLVEYVRYYVLKSIK